MSLKNTNRELQSELDALENEYLKTDNMLDLQLIEANQKLEELNLEKSTSDRELRTSRENLKLSNENNKKQFLISASDGVVMNLFNLEYAQNFVNKDQLLLSVIPDHENFYVKVKIPLARHPVYSSGSGCSP